MRAGRSVAMMMQSSVLYGIIDEQEEQLIFTFQKPEPQTFCLENDLN